MDIKELYNKFLFSAGIDIDSRTIKCGEIFFAITASEESDRSIWTDVAIEKGAICAVMNRESKYGKIIAEKMTEAPDADYSQYILVEDSVKTLQDLAKYHRSQFTLPIVGITGTNGKTTTKELCAAVTEKKYITIKTQGNYNNEIGVPLNLLRIEPSTEMAVIELAARIQGDIKFLLEIAAPTIGIVTNVGKGHLECFGSFDILKKTKGELLDYLEEKGYPALYNVDDEDIRDMVSLHPGLEAIPYGVDYNNVHIIVPTAKEPFLRFEIEREGYIYRIETQLIGDYNINNILAAIALGDNFGIEWDDVKSAIEEYTPSNNRSQLIKTDNNYLIIDAYNANPTSMKAALMNFERTDFSNKILMLGDMREIGTTSQQEHIAILKYVDNMSIDDIYLVGEEFNKAYHTLKENGEIKYEAHLYDDVEDLKSELREEHPIRNSTIFIKSSNGVRLFTLPEVFLDI